MTFQNWYIPHSDLNLAYVYYLSHSYVKLYINYTVFALKDKNYAIGSI